MPPKKSTAPSSPKKRRRVKDGIITAPPPPSMTSPPSPKRGARRPPASPSRAKKATTVAGKNPPSPSRGKKAKTQPSSPVRKKRATAASKKKSAATLPADEADAIRALTPSPIRLGRRLQKLHLVIDLDATFVDTRIDTNSNSHTTFLKVINSPDVTEEQREELMRRVYLFKLGGSTAWTILRPKTREFLDFATRYFRKVSVWTAGRKDYGEIITEILFEAPLQKPAIVFTWDECVKGEVDISASATNEEQVEQFTKKMASPSNKDIGFFSKPLMLIAKQDELDDVDSGLLLPKKKFKSSEFKFSKNDPLSDCLLLDDRSDIGFYNPNNIVKIPPFELRLTKKSLFAEDDALEKFAEWLLNDDIINATDIRDVDKDYIF